MVNRSQMRDSDNQDFDSYSKPAKRRKGGKNRDRNNSPMNKDERDDKLILNGIVEEALPGTWFRIKVTTGDVLVLATLSGKMRQNHIQILPGDKVTVEVSPYDTSRGRITRRN